MGKNEQCTNTLHQNVCFKMHSGRENLINKSNQETYGSGDKIRYKNARETQNNQQSLWGFEEVNIKKKIKKLIKKKKRSQMNFNKKIEQMDERVSLHQQQIRQMREQLDQILRCLERQQQLINEQPGILDEFKNLRLSSQEDDIIMGIFERIPTFSGNKIMYETWQTITCNAMEMIKNREGTMQYFHAEKTIRDKITGMASIVLKNKKIPINFREIINCLDQIYVCKKTIQSLEQELMMLHQAELTIDEFYFEINES